MNLFSVGMVHEAEALDDGSCGGYSKGSCADRLGYTEFVVGVVVE